MTQNNMDKIKIPISDWRELQTDMGLIGDEDEPLSAVEAMSDSHATKLYKDYNMHGLSFSYSPDTQHIFIYYCSGTGDVPVIFKPYVKT